MNFWEWRPLQMDLGYQSCIESHCDAILLDEMKFDIERRIKISFATGNLFQSKIVIRISIS